MFEVKRQQEKSLNASPCRDTARPWRLTGATQIKSRLAAFGGVTSALKADKPHAYQGPPSNHVTDKQRFLDLRTLMSGRPLQMNIRQKCSPKCQHSDIQYLAWLTPEHPGKE